MTNNAETICRNFNLTEQDQVLVRHAGELLQNDMQEFIDGWYQWLSTRDEFEVFFGSNPANLNRVKGLQQNYWKSFFESKIDEQYISIRRHIGQVHERINLPNEIYFAGMSIANQLIAKIIKRHKKLDQAKVDVMLEAVSKQIFVDTYLVLDEITLIQNHRILESSKAMMEMSTPVTPIWEGILLLPLLGIIDSERTQDIMNKTLAKISETRSKYFVLDISGVAAVDTAVANQLIKITKAIQLMGCDAIISGISPGIARTIVELGISVGEVKTTATLRDAFEIALKSLNVEVQ